MPISNTRRLMTSGALPKFDIKEPTFYAPFYRPDMVAKCGDITNGTGIISPSPTILAVGANTITNTQAGTFIVHMSEGGSVASGTATITGSPVTINAGVATSIIAEDTGNFVCTVSNIIRSKDKNSHALTILGATWGSQGRTFDMIDDYIDCGSATTIDDIFDGGGTIRAWIKPGSDGQGDLGNIINKYIAAVGGFIFEVNGEAAGFVKLGFYIPFVSGGNYWKTSTAVVPINTFSMVGMTYDSGAAANQPLFYLNGASTPITQEAASATLTRKSDAANSMIVGNVPALSRSFDGIIREVVGYKGRTLTAGEMMNYYLVGKGRY